MMDALRGFPERFEFVQAVRLLEGAAARAARAEGVAAPAHLGSDTDPRREPLRLRAAPELAFPAAEIAAYDASGSKPALSVTFLGLTGVSGVLPGYYARLVLEASRNKNTAPRDFADIFNHRALSLFLRAAGKYRLPLIYERSRDSGGDAISNSLLALVGMRGTAFKDRQALPDETLLFYAGHFSRGTRPADALRQMLCEYLDRPVTIKQFQGHWADLPPSEQTRLATGTRDQSHYGCLGSSAVLGTRVWDVQGSFRIQLGPLDYAAFQSFMPGAPLMKQLIALTRTYVGPALTFDVQLRLQGVEVPPLTLSSDPQHAARLGWNTWLPTRGARGDASDAVFPT